VLVGEYVLVSILGPLGVRLGVRLVVRLGHFLSVHAGAFEQKGNFCIFLGIQMEGKSISSTNFNSKF